MHTKQQLCHDRVSCLRVMSIIGDKAAAVRARVILHRLNQQEVIPRGCRHCDELGCPLRKHFDDPTEFLRRRQRK
jgi:hypothetical protein